jgi:hypothetical protein
MRIDEIAIYSVHEMWRGRLTGSRRGGGYFGHVATLSRLADERKMARLVRVRS